MVTRRVCGLSLAWMNIIVLCLGCENEESTKKTPFEEDTARFEIIDAQDAKEGDFLQFVVKLQAREGNELVLNFRGSFADASLNAQERSKREKLFEAGQYAGNGTVFTRSVAQMPLAENSAQIAAYVPTMPAQYVSEQFKSWLKTGLNTIYYNIPIYVVDSGDRTQEYANFDSEDARVIYRQDLIELTTGKIPFPAYGIPNQIGDYSLAIYDRGTGLMREYFYVKKQGAKSWRFSASGYYQASPNLWHLGIENYFMQLTTGSSAVVAMLNPLTQIGISEARAGQINHALSVTFPNAAKGVISFPAKQSDGTDEHPAAPAQGQWFRLDPELDLESLNLKPFTKVLARAVQRYGAYGADRNLWCFAFNAEHPVNEMAQGLENPWVEGGELWQKYGSLDINDFPWEHTQWAPVGWDGKGEDAGVYSTPLMVFAMIDGVKHELLFDRENKLSLSAQTKEFVVKVVRGRDQITQSPYYIGLRGVLTDADDKKLESSAYGRIVE